MANQTKYVPGEKVIFEIRPSFLILLGFLVPLVIAVAAIVFIFNYTGFANIWVNLIVLVAGILAALAIFLNWYTTIYRLTTRRAENHFGIFGSREEEISHEDIEAVDVEKTFWGALLNYGTILIKAAGEGREVDFPNVANPKAIAKRIEDMAIGEEQIPSQQS